ncbi:MAG: hypothetical protein ACLFQ6_11575 [Candidatus Sumerlaeia bacterium]
MNALVDLQPLPALLCAMIKICFFDFRHLENIIGFERVLEVARYDVFNEPYFLPKNLETYEKPRQ